MTRASYKLQQIFGATGATGILGQFGSLKAGTKVYSNDPDILQALVPFGAGLNSALINQAPPSIQEFNGLFNLMTRQISYQQQTGIAEWDASTIYFTGSLSQENGIIFRSLTDNNVNNALSDTVNWMLYANGKTVTVTDYDHDVAYDEEYIRVVNASPTEHVVIHLPYCWRTTGLQYVGRKITIISEIPSAAAYYAKVVNGTSLSANLDISAQYRYTTVIADAGYEYKWRPVLSRTTTGYQA